MKIQRLFEMGPAEMAFRGRQEVYKAVERLAPPPARKTACRLDRLQCDAGLRRLLDAQERSPSAENAKALQEALQERMGRRFFAGLQADGPEDDHPARRVRDFEDDAARLLARAEGACRGEFELLGYGPLHFGHPVNWHLDAVSGAESPRVHWSRLDPLDPSQVGDSKVVWELNRHQWLLDLGQAWRLTGDERYATCFADSVMSWIEDNPYGHGINWSSALEVAMRSLSWCWALCLFRDASPLTPERFQTLLGALQRHAAFIERYQSRYFAPNTHLTVEALALYVIGTILPELQGATRWRELGRRLLLEQLPIHVPSDGVYFEQSTRYQYYTLEIYLQFAILADRNGDVLPDEVNERLREMLRFLLELRRPDGSLPQIGDTDGGWLCPLVPRETGDYRGLFSTAACFLDDPELAWAAGAMTREAVRLLGAAAANAWQSLTAQPPAAQTLRARPSGGYVVMRSGWGPEDHQLIYDTGPLGCHICAGHGHADLLAVQVSAFGENYLVDPGTGCYTTGSAWRQHFRSTVAHSTARVDGLDQAETDGPFSWSEHPAAHLLEADPAPHRAYASAQHRAYARLEDPVIHRRRVWFIDAALWLIVDDFSGKARHQVDLGFQFAPLPVVQESGGWFRARGRDSALLLKTYSAADITHELTSGALSPPRGWYSPNYGKQVPAPLLTMSVQDRLPLRLATLLIPTRDPAAAPPAVDAEIRNATLEGLAFSGQDLALPDFSGPFDPLDDPEESCR